MPKDLSQRLAVTRGAGIRVALTGWLTRRAAGVLAAILVTFGAFTTTASAATATPYNTPSISWTSCSASQLTAQNGCTWTVPFDPAAGQMGYTASYTSNTQSQWDNYYYCDSTYWDFETWPDIASSNLWNYNPDQWTTTQADGKTPLQDSPYTVSATPVAGDLYYDGLDAYYVEAVLAAGNTEDFPAGTAIISGVGPESFTCEQHTGWYDAVTPSYYQDLPDGSSVLFISDPNSDAAATSTSPGATTDSGDSGTATPPATTSQQPAPKLISTGLTVKTPKLHNGVLTFKLSVVKGFATGRKTGSLSLTAADGGHKTFGKISTRGGRIRLDHKGRWTVTIRFRPATNSKYKALTKRLTEAVAAL